MSRHINHPEHFTRKMFNSWHRYALGDAVTMIDIDGLEYCRKCRAPLAFLETAQDVGQEIKPVTVLRTLAAQTDISAYVILFTVDKARPRQGSCERLAPRLPRSPSVSTARDGLAGDEP